MARRRAAPQPDESCFNTVWWRPVGVGYASTAIGSDCLGRTCLKWSIDGELTALDRPASVHPRFPVIALDQLKPIVLDLVRRS